MGLVGSGLRGRTHIISSVCRSPGPPCESPPSSATGDSAVCVPQCQSGVLSVNLRSKRFLISLVPNLPQVHVHPHKFACVCVAGPSCGNALLSSCQASATDIPFPWIFFPKNCECYRQAHSFFSCKAGCTPSLYHIAEIRCYEFAGASRVLDSDAGLAAPLFFHFVLYVCLCKHVWHTSEDPPVPMFGPVTHSIVGSRPRGPTCGPHTPTWASSVWADLQP